MKLNKKIITRIFRFRVRLNDRSIMSRDAQNFGCKNSAALGFIEKSYLIYIATQNELPSLSLLFMPGRISATHP